MSACSSPLYPLVLEIGGHSRWGTLHFPTRKLTPSELLQTAEKKSTGRREASSFQSTAREEVDYVSICSNTPLTTRSVGTLILIWGICS